MAKQRFDQNVIKNVIKKNKNKREVTQLSIKIDAKLNKALEKLSSSIKISKNKLIEDILYESGIIDEVEENYCD